MMLAGFNPNQIENIKGARETILHLFNLKETLKVENDQLRDENQRLRDEVKRLKGGRASQTSKPGERRAGSEPRQTTRQNKNAVNPASGARTARTIESR